MVKDEASGVHRGKVCVCVWSSPAYRRSLHQEGASPKMPPVVGSFPEAIFAAVAKHGCPGVLRTVSRFSRRRIRLHGSLAASAKRLSTSGPLPVSILIQFGTFSAVNT